MAGGPVFLRHPEGYDNSVVMTFALQEVRKSSKNATQGFNKQTELEFCLRPNKVKIEQKKRRKSLRSCSKRYSLT